MSLSRHAVAWAAMIAGAAFTTAMLWPAAVLQALAAHWQVDLEGWIGVPRTVRLVSAVDLARPGGLLALRAATLGAWSWLVLPVWLAAAVQGEVCGRLRRRAFGAVHPGWHALSGHVAVAIGGLVLLVLALPVQVPVGCIPAAGLLLSVPIGLRFMHRPAWGG
jgi:hypothetical protein